MALELYVTSGKYRHQRLLSPASSKTHPMGAREKLALFNMISVRGTKIADIYAGSGALGIEALSRGAQAVVFVEKDPKVAATIRDNLRRLPDYDQLQTQVLCESAAKFTQRAEFHQYFDMIFADPPYDKINVAEIAQLAELLTVNGQLILSSPATEMAPDLAGFALHDTRTYAGARLSFYGKAGQ